VPQLSLHKNKRNVSKTDLYIKIKNKIKSVPVQLEKYIREHKSQTGSNVQQIIKIKFGHLFQE